MTFDTFILKCEEVQNALLVAMPDISDELALNAIALIKNRIVDRKEGIAGAHYSTNPMLATKEQFIVKSAFKQTKVEETRYHRVKDKNNFHESQIGKKKAKGGNEKKIVKKGLWIKFPSASKAVPVMELPQGYKQFREIQGRQGEVVNLSYTGKMWQGLTIVGRLQQGRTWGTIIGGGNIEAQQKLGWMADKYGNFLAVLPDETEKLQVVFNARLQSVITKTFQS